MTKAVEPFMHLNCPHEGEIWGVSPANSTAVVSNKPQPGGKGNDAWSVGAYGGYLVCESCSEAGARSIVHMFNSQPRSRF